MRLRAWRESEYFKFDVIAVALGVGMLILFACTADRGVGVPDECYYYTVAHRLSLGDKMIADEWNLAQLVHLFNLLPNLLFMKLAGGTEGLVLFMRCFFIAVNTAFYAFVYGKLRRFKGWGAAAALLFGVVIQQTLLTLSYFTVAPMAALTVWLILADDRKPHSVPTLLLAGLTMACGILAEPFLIGIFFLWLVLTCVRELLRKKHSRFPDDYDFVLNRRTFFWMSVGAAILFFPYMGYLVFSGSFRGVGSAIPYMFSGEEYNKGNLIDLRKVRNAIEYYGVPCIAGSAVCLLAAVGFRVRKQKDPRAKRIIFAASCVFLAAGYVVAGSKMISGKDMNTWVCFLQYNNLTLLLFAPTLWFLCSRKTPRLLVLWVSGVLFSVLVDISSVVILASGGGLLRLCSVLQLSVLIPEMKAEAKRRKIGKHVKTRKLPMRVLQGVAAVCAAAALLWNTGYVCCETVVKPFEFLFTGNHLSVKLDKGPFKGLRTNETVAAVYKNMLTDLDTIRGMDGERKPVAVIGLMPFAYLYMDLPYGAYSAWYEHDEPERLAAYWRLHPEHVPAILYVPYAFGQSYLPNEDWVMEERMDGIRELVSGEITEGAAGYIITGVSVKEYQEQKTGAVA